MLTKNENWHTNIYPHTHFYLCMSKMGSLRVDWSINLNGLSRISLSVSCAYFSLWITRPLLLLGYWESAWAILTFQVGIINGFGNEREQLYWKGKNFFQISVHFWSFIFSYIWQFGSFMFILNIHFIIIYLSIQSS